MIDRMSLLHTQADVFILHCSQILHQATSVVYVHMHVLKLPFISILPSLWQFLFQLAPCWTAAHALKLWLSVPKRWIHIIYILKEDSTAQTQLVPLESISYKGFAQTPWLWRGSNASKSGLFFSEQGQRDAEQTQYSASPASEDIAWKDTGGYLLITHNILLSVQFSLSLNHVNSPPQT